MATKHSLQEMSDSITDLLIRVKGELSVSTADNARLVDDLNQLAALGERLTEMRPKTASDAWMRKAELLDSQGVHLWNASSMLSQFEDPGCKSMVAALRLAAFRLMEAGLERDPDIQSQLHMLEVASITGATLSECGNHAAAAGVLGYAAKFEELLRNGVDLPLDRLQARARATVVYLSCRMEAAFRGGNESVAEYMLDKVTAHIEQCLAGLSSHDYLHLAAKVLEIGESILRVSDGDKERKARIAVLWLQKALSITEKAKEGNDGHLGAVPGAIDLKHCILVNLANAYYFSASHDAENLTRAEDALRELLQPPNSTGIVDNGKRSSDYQQMRWMMWTLLKRRKAGEPVLLEAFNSILDNVEFSEDTVSVILRELKSIPHLHTLVTALILRCLSKAIEGQPSSCESSDIPFIDLFLLSLIFHCARGQDHERAMTDLDTAINCGVSKAEYGLPDVTVSACVALFWQYGNQHYQAKRWARAADWFAVGTHKVFRGFALSKNYRKAAMCYIQQGDFPRAIAIANKCPKNEAATYYVVLIAAIQQGLEDEAFSALHGIIKAPDCDRNMLLFATQLSHESNMRTLLLFTLEVLLNNLKAQNGPDTIGEGVMLIKCIIRLVQSLLTEPAADAQVLSRAMVKYFSAACSLLRSAQAKNLLVPLSKDISWLWRTAFNSAIQGCAEWEYAEESICALFEVSRELMEIYCEVSSCVVDADVHLKIIDASFAAISGRVTIIRESTPDTGSLQDGRRLGILSEIGLCKEKITIALSKHTYQQSTAAARLCSFLHVLMVFEIELLADAKEWARITQLAAQTLASDVSTLDTFEAVADILCAQPSCPVDVLLDVLESILHASLRRNYLSLENFSRWLRGVCTVLLARNTTADRVKAIGYVEQAIAVMNENLDRHHDQDETYPLDERQWLLAKSYNTGIECLYARKVEEARRWFEAATVICKFIPDGSSSAEKVREAKPKSIDMTKVPTLRALILDISNLLT